jgi:hypothetical protein
VITREEAKQKVLELLQSRRVGGDEGIDVIESKTIEKPYGWAFFYNSRRFIETGDIMHSLVGGGPVVVVASTGEVHELGSSRPAFREIADLEKKLGLSP